MTDTGSIGLEDGLWGDIIHGGGNLVVLLLATIINHGVRYELRKQYQHVIRSKVTILLSMINIKS